MSAGKVMWGKRLGEFRNRTKSGDPQISKPKLQEVRLDPRT